MAGRSGTPSDALTRYLRTLADAGITHVPKAPDREAIAAAAIRPAREAIPDRATTLANPATRGESLPGIPSRSALETAEPRSTGNAPPAAADQRYSPGLPPDRRAAALQVLADEVAGCVRCTELAQRRSRTVFGVGTPQARVCFFGEAPGAEEDRQGEPFVGAAGKLLDRMLAACTWSRDQVYILNTLKCRPPGNRNPAEPELDACRGFWERQLDIIQPEYIVCLGSFAVRSLLATDSSIAKLRGRFHRYRGSKVVATYHPAYLLRNESAKRLAWEDLKMLMADMGVALPR